MENLVFEPNSSFAYNFSRKVVLEELEEHPAVASGEPFHLLTVAVPIIEGHLTPEQLANTYPRANNPDQFMKMRDAIKFFTRLLCKNSSPWLEDLGAGNFRLKSVEDVTNEELDEAEEDDEIEIGIGWVYAYSFPVLVKQGLAFPIKVGKTASDVGARVAEQARGAALFEPPVLLGSWKVKNVTHAEQAIHQLLKQRGKWVSDAPGREWFATTLEEIKSLIDIMEPA